MNIFSFIKAKYRLFFGFCPKCNSSAPEIDSCNVCLSSRDYPPTQKQKDEMFKRFLLCSWNPIETAPTKRH